MGPISTIPSKTKEDRKPKNPSKSAAHRKSNTHNQLGVYKGGRKRQTPRARAETLKQLTKTLPTLNTIVPAEAAKAGKGKQKKTYVNDGDQDMLRRIVEQVASGVDRGIESKLEKARRLETIREARLKEDEAREREKNKKKDEAKEKIKSKRTASDEKAAALGKAPRKGKGRKSVGGAMGGPGAKRVQFATQP